MNVNPEILSSEFIGTKMKITKSKNICQVGLSGTIVDETRNTFVITGTTGPKRVAKALITLNFIFRDNTIVEVEGKLLIGRPEDRLKKTIRRLW
jgi:ribonuclease P protein subunit POP4